MTKTTHEAHKSVISSKSCDALGARESEIGEKSTSEIKKPKGILKSPIISTRKQTTEQSSTVSSFNSQHHLTQQQHQQQTKSQQLRKNLTFGKNKIVENYSCEPNTSDLEESNHPNETNEMDDTDDEYLTTSVTYEGPNSEQLLTESSTHKLDENTNQNSNKNTLKTTQSNDEDFDDYEYQENLSNISQQNQIDSSSRREGLANEHTM